MKPTTEHAENRRAIDYSIPLHRPTASGTPSRRHRRSGNRKCDRQERGESSDPVTTCSGNLVYTDSDEQPGKGDDNPCVMVDSTAASTGKTRSRRRVPSAVTTCRRFDVMARLVAALISLSIAVSLLSLISMSLTYDGVLVLEERKEGAAATFPRNKRRIFTVFSTSCLPYQDWQSQLVVYNHHTLGVEGELVRLLSCDDPGYVLPRNSYDRYRVVRTPDFDKLFPDDPWSVRNKPHSVSYWLNGRSNDTDLPLDDDVVVLSDPDMTFLSNYNNVSSVKEGVGMAAQYDLGNKWVKKWGLPFCNGKCDDVSEDGYDASFGAPYILTAGDARRHADVWTNVTEQMRKVNGGWMVDMFSGIIAYRLLDLRIDVRPMMVSDVESEQEPWDQVRWQVAPPHDGVWVAHYCQGYEVGAFEWYKEDFEELDIRQCNRSLIFSLPNKHDLAKMERYRNGPLKLMPEAGEEKVREKKQKAVYRSRNVWLLDKTWEQARRAIAAYYEEFC